MTRSPPSEIFVQDSAHAQGKVPQKAASSCSGCKKSPGSIIVPAEREHPTGQSRGSRSKPLPTTHPHDLGNIRPPWLFPKPLLVPGIASQQRREGRGDNQVRFQRAPRHGGRAGKAARGVEVFTGELRSHTRSTLAPSHRGRALRVLTPHPAPPTPHSPSPARAAADGAPGGGFPPGWGWSSHMQPATKPKQPCWG